MDDDHNATPAGGETNAREKVLLKRRQIRDAIRAAALEEFASKGFAGASTQAIAQRAGLTKPQLHYYISSKEELYEDILVYVLEDWKQIFISASAGQSPADIIRSYIHKKIDYSLSNAKASRLITTEIANGAPYLSRHWGQHHESTREAGKLIQSWVDKGLIRPVDPLLFQMHLWAVTQHYADFDSQIRSVMRLGAGEEMNIEHVKNEVSTLFLRACGLE